MQSLNTIAQPYQRTLGICYLNNMLLECLATPTKYTNYFAALIKKLQSHTQSLNLAQRC